MSSFKPIEIWKSGGSPNPWKVIIILEELGIPYTLHQVEFTDVKKEPFVSLNPNGRVPAMKDPNHDMVLWESGAIIDYIVDIYDTEGRLHYDTIPEKYLTRSWEHFQMSGQGPYFGQRAWFSLRHPEKIQSAVDRYTNEIKRVIGVIDSHLEKSNSDLLVGDKVTYADLMFVPYFRALGYVIAPELDTSSWKNYSAWYKRLTERPAVVRALTAQAAEGK